MSFGTGISALDLWIAPPVQPLLRYLPHPTQAIQRRASSCPKSELSAHFREKKKMRTVKPIRHPSSGGQICSLGPTCPTRAGLGEGRAPRQCVLCPEGGTLGDRRPLPDPAGSRRATALPRSRSQPPAIAHVLPPCHGSGNCGLGPAWVPESDMAVVAAETRVFLEVRRRLQSALLILG